MGKCCVECASLFKISKETGQIIWSKNLGFDVTAIARHSDRIYAAIRPINRYDSILFSYYDVIVLNLDGDIIEEECVNVFPKNTKDIQKTPTTEFKRGISAPNFDSFSQLHVFEKYNEDEDKSQLYIIGISGSFIYQIINGKLTRLQNVISFDDFFEGDLLYFISGNIPFISFQRLGESSNISRFKIEIGGNYISYRKYSLLGYNYDNEDSRLPKAPSTPDVYVLNIGNEDEADDDNKYIHISAYKGNLYKYEIETDKTSYSKFTFDESEFPLISPIQVPETAYTYDDTKTFDSNGGINTHYYEYSGFNDGGDMSYDYDILYKNGHPIVPDFYVSTLNLVTFDYNFQKIKSANDRESIESVFNAKNIINNTDVRIPRRVRNKFEVSTTGLEVTKVDRNRVIRDSPPSTPPKYYYTEDIPIYYNNLKVLDIVYGPDNLITKLKYNDGMSCGWYDKPVKEIASTSITLEDPDFKLTFFGHDQHYNGGYTGLDYLYTLIQHVHIQATGYLNKVLKPTAEAKLKQIAFQKNSKSYIKDGKIIFNASLYLTYQVYIDIYAVSAKPEKGDSIQFNWEWDGYIVHAQDGAGNAVYNRTTTWPGYTETYKRFSFAQIGDSMGNISEGLEYYIEGVNGYKEYDKVFGGDSPWTLLFGPGQHIDDGSTWINRDRSVMRIINNIGSSIIIVTYTFLPPILTDEHPLIHLYSHQQLAITFHVYGGKKAPYGGISLRKDVLISLDIASNTYDIIYLDDKVNTNSILPIDASSGQYLFEQVIAPVEFVYDVDTEIYSEHPKEGYNKLDPPRLITTALTDPEYPIIYNDVSYESDYGVWEDFDISKLENYKIIKNNEFDDNRINTSLRYRLITKDNENVYTCIKSDDGYRFFHKYRNREIFYNDVLNTSIPVPIDGIAYNYNHSTGDGLPSWKIVFNDILSGNKDNRLEELYERFPNLFEKYDIAEQFLIDTENELDAYYDELGTITDNTEYEIAIQKYPLTFLLDLYKKGISFNEMLLKHTDYFVDIIEKSGLYPNSRTIKVQLRLAKSDLKAVINVNQAGAIDFIWDDVYKDLDLDIDIDKTTAEDLIENQIKKLDRTFIKDFDFTVLSNGPLIERPILLELPKRTVEKTVKSITKSDNPDNPDIIEYTYTGVMYAMEFKDVKEDLYEKERYSISCFTNNPDTNKYEVKWDSKFLIPPRRYTDFTKEKELEGKTYNAHNMYYGYYAGEPVMPLDITQDNDFLYLGTQKRKVFRQNYIDNSGELQRENLGAVPCGELSNAFFKDYLE